jgi:hypothetical protein
VGQNPPEGTKRWIGHETAPKCQRAKAFSAARGGQFHAARDDWSMFHGSPEHSAFFAARKALRTCVFPEKNRCIYENDADFFVSQVSAAHGVATKKRSKCQL